MEKNKITLDTIKEFEKSLHEDNELEPTQNLDIDVAEGGDELDDRLIALSEYLECDPFMIEKSDWGEHHYKVVDGEHEGEEWMILTDEEADEEQYESARSLLEDIGFEQCGLDIENYVSDDYCEDSMRDFIESDVDDMSDDDVIDELLEHEIISLDDEEWFELKDDVDQEDEDFDEEDVSNYELKKSMDDARQELIDYKEDDDLVKMFWDYGYGDWIEEEVAHCHGNFPYYIDEERAIGDLVRGSGRGQDINCYDGSEEEIGTDDDGNTLYGYMVDKR